MGFKARDGSVGAVGIKNDHRLLDTSYARKGTHHHIGKLGGKCQKRCPLIMKIRNAIVQPDRAAANRCRFRLEMDRSHSTINTYVGVVAYGLFKQM